MLIGVGPQIYLLTELADKLTTQGISSTVINARYVKPIDPDIGKVIEKIGKAVIIEENSIAGGFGSAVFEHLSSFSRKVNFNKIKTVGIPDQFIMHGNTNVLKKEIGLTVNNLIRISESVLKED